MRAGRRGALVTPRRVGPLAQAFAGALAAVGLSWLLAFTR